VSDGFTLDLARAWCGEINDEAWNVFLGIVRPVEGDFRESTPLRVAESQLQ
jgi:hypothetical protein